MSTFGLSQYLVRHQHLQELVVTWTRFDVEPFVQDIVMPELRFLVVEESLNFPWDNISAPLLGVVEIDTYDDRDVPISFLCRHPSIHRLQYSYLISITGFKEIAKAMVNLNSLCLRGSFKGLFREIDPDIPFPPFPKLKTLELFYQSPSDLSLQDFEQLMRVRCLPQQSLDKKEIETISLLTIHLETDELDSAPWRRSSLLDHVQQRVEGTPLESKVTLEMPRQMRGNSPI